MALNDVVVHKKDVARMIELETYIDGAFLNSNRSDGLIVATPTGSTAYALSGGGPILHPRLGALTLVPICPHTLSNRPIVVHDDSVIEIIVHEGTHAAQLSCDGQLSQPLESGDHCHGAQARAYTATAAPARAQLFQRPARKTALERTALSGVFASCPLPPTRRLED